jgi:hypothetical protein
MRRSFLADWNGSLAEKNANYRRPYDFGQRSRHTAASRTMQNTDGWVLSLVVTLSRMHR